MKAKEQKETGLAERECIPCKEGTEPLKGEGLTEFKRELSGGWEVVEDHHLEKEFKFADFAEALEFVNDVGDLAEDVGHHPDIYLTWGKVKLTVWTHKIGGLSEADFVFAAKVDRLEQ